MRGFQFRYLMPVALISACLVALSAVTAMSLFGQQESVTRVLRENVQSHRAAVELEECLLDLIALEDDRVFRVTVLHDRARTLLGHLRRFADQPEEQALHTQMRGAFDEYLGSWERLPSPTTAGYEDARKRATRFLESAVVKPCQEFEAYNTLRLSESSEHHDRILRQLAWGMAGVGVMGGVAGLVIGYGVARGLARSIRRLHVQLRDAAGKLGPNLPEIVLTEDGDFGGLHAEIDRLSRRIEQVVRELQARELEVLRADQLAAVGQLAAGVAHEIRNPLTSIKLLVQAGRQEGGELAGEDLEVIEGEVRRMERSLNTFLEFARPPKLQRTAVALDPLVAGVFGLLRVRAERLRVELTVEMPPGVVVAADPEQLRQVLVNLGLNALDAMPSGGRLSVGIRRQAGRVEIAVADTGPGIAPEMLPRLFQPFASGKDTGLGLGLVISRRIVEDHGGTLTAANRPAGGAEFLVRLPAEDA
jgi:signal transduction histidine kinase